MKKMIALVLSVIVCTCLFVGCGAAGTNAQNTRTITDSAGRQVEVPEKVESIVCVGVGEGKGLGIYSHITPPLCPRAVTINKVR